MRIWSIQSEKAWDYLNHHGTLKANAAHRSGEWPHAYDWMYDQLIQRIGPPAHNDIVPLWGWYQWAGENLRRPDLRSLRHHWGPNGDYIMIECEIPDNEILLSDHDAWHVPLGNSYLAFNEAEDNQFDKKLKQAGWKYGQPRPQSLLPEIHKSWERIFDLEALSGEYWGLMKDKSIQASFWDIRLDQVKSAKLFTSKRLKP